MVILMLGCGPGPSPVSTVEGVQVVGIETFPPEPSLYDLLRFKAWVADGRGYGADVLLWMCTPVDGECLEAYPPTTLGLPLQLWTFRGVADPVLDVTSAWPTLVGIAQALAEEVPDTGPDAAGRARTTTATTFSTPEPVDGLIVWALACAPGACPIVDAVAHDPVAGSEAWRAVAHDLANPQEWLEDIPPGEASLAVKVVPFHEASDLDELTFGTTTGTDDGVPNHAPTITVIESHLGPDAGIVTFQVTDVDEDDEVLQRAFATSGAVELTTSTLGSGSQWLTWRGGAVKGPATLFLVAEDGVGGTTVWSSAVETGTCGDPPAIELRQASGGAIDAGEPLLLDTAFGGSFRASGHLTGFRVRPSAVQLTVSVDGTVHAGGEAPIATWSPDTCSGTFEDAVVAVQSFDVLGTVCALGGRIADLEARAALQQADEPVDTGGDSEAVPAAPAMVTSEVPVVVTLDEAWPCVF